MYELYTDNSRRSSNDSQLIIHRSLDKKIKGASNGENLQNNLFFSRGRSNSIASENNKISKKIINGKSQGSSPHRNNSHNYY